LEKPLAVTPAASEPRRLALAGDKVLAHPLVPGGVVVVGACEALDNLDEVLRSAGTGSAAFVFRPQGKNSESDCPSR